GGCALPLEKVLKDQKLPAGGRASQTEQECMLEPLAVGRWLRPLAQDPCGQPLGNLKKCRVVQEREGLQGRVGAKSARAALDPSGSVEGGQEGVGRRPPEERVKPAAISVRTGIGPPRAFHLAQCHDSLGLGREDARAADLARQKPTRGQG